MSLGALFTNEPADPYDFIPSLIINFSGLLAILCSLFITAFIVTIILPKHLGRVKEVQQKFRDLFGNTLYTLIWLIPVTATLLSLTMSEFLGFVPCRLCWYQRVFMYSLAVLMLFYYFRRAKWMRITGYLFCAIGAAIALYHNFIEYYPQFESKACDPSVPCASPWFYAFGLLTLASMAFLAFTAVAVMLYMTSKDQKHLEKSK